MQFPIPDPSDLLSDINIRLHAELSTEAGVRYLQQVNQQLPTPRAAPKTRLLKEKCEPAHITGHFLSLNRDCQNPKKSKLRF